MRKTLDFADLDFIDQQETAAQIERARKSLIWFTKTTKENYVQNWHHVVTCQYLRRWMSGEIPNLIISQPPRHGKSEIASVRLPPFIFGQDPNARIISTAYSSDLASKNNRQVQRVIDSPIYQRIFPRTTLAGHNTRTLAARPIRNSDEFEIVGHRGTYRSAGIGGGITGMGADYFLIDDPIKNDEEANSETYREKIWEWWLSTAFTRLEENSRVLLIMTRWHEDDLAGRLLAQAKADPMALQWTELRFEATKEDMSVPDDPRAVGEALWPAKYPESRLATIKGTIGPRWWNSLYQQRPTALEGGIIKGKWIRYYTELPPTFHSYLQSWDATFKDNDGTDYVVGTVWGVYTGKKYLLDMVRARMGFTDTCEAIVAMSKKWPKARRKLIEDKANGSAILDSLKRPGMYDDGTPRPAITGLIAVDPGKLGSKTARLTACQTDFQSGDVLLPHPSIAPWVQLVVDELVKFPNARYDDIADSVSQALNDLSGGESVVDKIARL